MAKADFYLAIEMKSQFTKKNRSIKKTKQSILRTIPLSFLESGGTRFDILNIGDILDDLK